MKILFKTNLLLLFYLNIFHAQPLMSIRGKVVDAATNEPLPSAIVKIINTSQGTISNTQGEFRYSIKDTTANLAISFVGYRSDTILVSIQNNYFLIIKLQPSAIQMAEVFIIGENPAYEIIRAAIESKKKWMKRLTSYEGKAFTRLVIRAQDSIAAITESYSTLYWRNDDSLREVITQQKQTGNLPKGMQPARVGNVLNFNDDTISMGGFKFTGITSPDAFSKYDYKLITTRTMDDFNVYEIQVIPKSRISPLFKGTIAIAEKSYAVIEADLETNEAFVQPFIRYSKTHYKQKFQLFENSFWLPAHYQFLATVEFGVLGISIPPIGIDRNVVIYEYRVNPELPDSLRRIARTTVDSSAKKNDSTFWAAHEVLPLTAEQDSAYQKLDSTATLEKQFAPRGVMFNFLNTISTGVFSYLDIGFNRVEAWHLGTSKRIDTLVENIGVRGGLAYGTADKKWKWHAGATYQFGEPVKKTTMFGNAAISFSDKRWRTDIDFYDQLKEFPLVLTKQQFYNLISCLFDHIDAYDYYSARGVIGSITYLPASTWKLSLTGRSEEQCSAIKSTEYSWFNRSNVYPNNPAIIDGIMRSITFGVKYLSTEIISLAQNAMSVIATVEHSASFLGSDHSFTQFNIKTRTKISTMDYDLLMPPSFMLTVNAGTTAGHLPPQQYFSLASNVLFIGEQGTLHNVGSREFYGDSYLICSAEYNFRRAPFALSGIRMLYESKLEFLITGAFARTWFSKRTLRLPQFPVSDTKGLYYEAGFGISNIFDVFRLDFTYRFSQPTRFEITLLLSDFIAGFARQ